jgi:hypothetical protein
VSALLVLTLTGLLVAAAVRGEARPVIGSRGTVAVALGMLLGYVVVVVVLATAYPSPDATGPVYLGLQAVAMLVIALALALPEAPSAAAKPAAVGSAVVGSAAAQPIVTRRSLALATAGALVLAVAHLTGETYLALAAAAIGLPVVLIAAGVSRRLDLRSAQTKQVSRRSVRIGRLRFGQPANLVQTLNLLVFWALVAATALPATYDILAEGIPGGATAVRAGVVVGAAVAALVSLVPRRRVLAAANVLVAACSVFLVAELMATYQSPGGAVTLSAPFAGDWYVVQGGHSELVNSHAASASQREALDIVGFSKGSSHAGDGTKLADYYAFDAPVLAPADGVVVYLSDALADRPPAAPDPDAAHAEGNHMVIDIGNGRYLHVAHLEQNSALVNVGDRVLRGQALARVGNSGASDQPHLHIQVQNSPRPDIHDAGVNTFPIVFRGVALIRDGRTSHPAAADLRRGDRLHADTW